MGKARECVRATCFRFNMENPEHAMSSVARGTGGNITAADYLNTHILFFKDYDSVNDRYFGFISDPSDFQLTLDSNNETDIYWIWPRTFGQLVLTDSNEDSQYTQGGTPVLDRTRNDYNNDKNAVYSYISRNLNTMFKAPTVTAVDYSGAFTDMQSKRTSGTDYNAEYSTLSTGYICINQRILSRKMTKKKLILAKKRREKSNQVKNNQTKAKLRSK